MMLVEYFDKNGKNIINFILFLGVKMVWYFASGGTVW